MSRDPIDVVAPLLVPEVSVACGIIFSEKTWNVVEQLNLSTCPIIISGVHGLSENKQS